MSYILIGSIGVGYLIHEISGNSKWLNVGVVLVVIIWNLSLINPKFFLGENTTVKSRVKYIPYWMEWNYKGFEEKDVYVQNAIPLFNYLKKLPYGKVMWEYRPEYDAYGTPRFLENIPILTGKPTFEGLLIESSVFGPFHFINQTETTQSPTSAIAGFKYPPFDFEKGVKHLKLSNAKYFVAYTPTIKSLAHENMNWLSDVGDFSVYEIPDSEMIDVYGNFNMVKKEKEWIKKSIDWYKNGDLSQPIVFYNSNKQKDSLDLLNYNDTKDISNDIRVIELTDTKISFETDDINKLHIIKVSYFPTWKVKGGEGPFLVSPSFIGVIPKEKNVTIYFGQGLIDTIAYMLTYLTIALIIIKLIKPKWFKFI